MKRLILILSLSINTILIAQPWTYNFGSGTGTYNTASGTSTTFLPAPSTNGGTSFVRIGSAGGSFNLDNPGTTLGTDTELSGIGPTSTSVNKFSIYSYTAATSFTIRFSIRFDGGSSGSWSFYQGTGTDYSNGSTVSANEVFTGLRFTFSASDAITLTVLNSSGSYVAGGISGTPFAQKNNYVVEIYGNNTLSTINYTYGSSMSVVANKFDLWVDGVLVGDDISKAGLTDNSNIDSFMFYGINSASNVATIYLDDFYYTNMIASTPLPVELTSFTSNVIGSKVQLNWQTATEVNNYGFEIERSQTSNVKSETWEKIGFVQGNGNSNSPKNYSFIDQPTGGKEFKYRLKQIDFDGAFEYSYEVTAKLGNVSTYKLDQNYPNPFNPYTKISYTIPQRAYVHLRVYDMLAKEVAELINTNQEAGRYEITFDGTNLPSGAYFYKLEAGNYIEVKKLLLVK
ncbi:MAG: T9SS type A sorting domain-containing protein [Melioribacteraceae bacterium]